MRGFEYLQRVLNSLQSLFTQEQRYVVNRVQLLTVWQRFSEPSGGGWQGRPNRTLISQETSEVMEQRTDSGHHH